MLKFISEIIAPSTPPEEEDLSHGVNSGRGDAGLNAEELLAQVHKRRAPILHVEDDIENTAFEQEYRLCDELANGVFAFSCRRPPPTQSSSVRLLSGKSLSGKVPSAALDLTGMNVVCRIYVSQDDDYNVNYVSKELEVLRLLYSPYVTNLYAHYESPSGHRLIVDHFTGSLTSVIECRGFCEGYVASILKQILLGVAHLHSVGVVHRHLTPDNVLLNIVHPNKVAHVKLTGFGHAAVLPAGEALELFGRNRFSIKGGFVDGFSTRSTMSYRSVRSGKASVKASEVVVGPRFGRSESGMEPIAEQPSPMRNSKVPTEGAALLEEEEQFDERDPEAEARAAEAQFGPPVTAAVVLHEQSEADSTPHSQPGRSLKQSELELVPQTNGGDSPGEGSAMPHLVKMDTFDQPVRLITRPAARSNKYRYTTSVQYDVVPFKSYDKITGGLSSEEASDFSYFSPEMLGGHYGPQVDTWAAGVVAYQMLAGHLPFTSQEGIESTDLVSIIMSGVFPVRGKIWRSLSELSRAFVTDLLVVDPTQRLSPEEALQHGWITDTTAAAAQASKHAAAAAPSSPYTYIIAPKRASLKSMLGASRTSSNVSCSTAHDPVHQQSRDGGDGDDSTLSPRSDKQGRNHSDAARLYPTLMEEEGDDIPYEDERGDFLFNAF